MRGRGLAPFYLVCGVAGLVVEQWRGTDRQVVLQRLAQQRVAPITCRTEARGCRALRKPLEGPSPVASPLPPPYLVPGPWAGGTV